MGALAITIGACGRSPNAADLVEIPSVTPLSLDQLGSNGPELKRSAFAVSPYGHVAFTTGFTEGDELITIVDSAGQVVSRVGRQGSGPGEIRDAFVLFFQDSVLFAADVFQGRLHQYTIQGEYREYIQFPGSYIPVGHVRDSVDLNDHSGITGPRVIRWALNADTGYRTLVPQNDSLFNDFGNRSSTMPPSLGIGSNPTGTVLGDGTTYQLFDYGPTGIVEFGRNQSPEVRGVDPAEDTVASFGWYSFGFDGAGRFWVAGKHRAGGFLDIYQGHELLRRLETDCRVNDWHGLSISGDWLALLCDAAEAAETEVYLQLYRIDG
jgi:hypothetical protein